MIHPPMKYLVPAFLALAAIGIARPVDAHSAVFDCFAESDGKISCEGGFSDGASAEGVAVRVLDPNEKVLVSGKIDRQGRFAFARPEGDFHVVFDAGSGHSVTLFSTDIS
jgi:hypothetical protein